MIWLAAFFFLLPIALAFILTIKTEMKMTKKFSVNRRNEKYVTVEIPLGPGYKSAQCSFRPLFANSKFLTVTYPVPFELNIDKPPKNFPAPIVNKDSSRDGGEEEGNTNSLTVKRRFISQF